MWRNGGGRMGGGQRGGGAAREDRRGGGTHCARGDAAGMGADFMDVRKLTEPWVEVVRFGLGGALGEEGVCRGVGEFITGVAVECSVVFGGYGRLSGGGWAYDFLGWDGVSFIRGVLGGGDAGTPRRTVGTVEQEYEPTTAEEKQDRRNEMKARATLLMALPNKDQLKFHSYQDAKLLMEAIEKRYGGNKESKKVQRTLLKQQYENFAALSSETMDQTFDRLQKLISQLEIQGEVINQEDMNLKLLRSLPSEWKTHALIWRNKVEIETISLDDLYNNLKIYEPELTGSSSTSQNSQNVAFVSNSTNNTNNTNKADDTAHGVSTTHTQGNGVNYTSLDNLCDAVICAFLASQPNSPQLSQEDLEQLHPDDLEEMDLQWEMAMLTIRARRFIKRTGKKLDINGQRVGFDKSKVECYNCHKHGHFARECRFPRNQENKGRENNSRTVPIESPTQNALIAQDGIGGYDWSYQAEEEQPTNHALMAFTSSGSSSSSDSEVDSCSKTCVKAYATLKEQYDSLSSDYKKSQFNLVSYKAGLESVEARLAHYKKNEAVFEESINVLKLEVRLRDNALNEYKMNLEKAEKERDQLKQTLEKFQNSSKSLNDLLESQVIDKFKTGLGYDAATAASPAVESFVNLSDKSGSDKGYHSVPPPLTGNFIPRKPDLTFMDEIVESENLDVTTVLTPSNEKTVENKGVFNTVESNTVRRECCVSINEELVLDGKKKTVFPTVSKIEFVGPKQPEKPVRKPVKYAEMYRSQRPRGNQRNWNNQKSQQLGSDFVMCNKACFVCGNFDHLKKDCSKRMVKPVWNNARRGNHQNSTRMTHPNSKRNMIPQAVLMRSGLKTINTARSRAAVNAAKPKAVHNVVKRNRFHDVKASGRHEHEPEFDFDAANILVTTTGSEISTSSPEVKTDGDSIKDIVDETFVYIRRSAAKAKDKAVRLQAELDKEERQRISRAEGLIQEVLQKIFIQAERSRR
ncbi:ribonuclease H-like domain-containing protein [Tanacetum coccineum]